MKPKTFFIFIILFFATHFIHGQSWNDPGKPMKGKVRIVNDSIHISNKPDRAQNIRFRAFSVDSVTSYSSFGNHYCLLKNVIGKDPVPAVYLFNAVYWEKTQRYFIGATFLFGAATFIYGSLHSENQHTFGTLFYIDLGFGTGILTSYIFKRHWANKAIRTWNKDLDTGKFHY